MSKLTERAVVNQLCLHSECGFPLPPCQSAYRAGHSTETDLVKVQSDILLNMDYILIDTPQQLAKCTNMSIDIRGSGVHASMRRRSGQKGDERAKPVES